MARRPGIAALGATAALLAVPNSALAVTNAVDFSAKIAMATTPSATAPANTGFEWAHHITTAPAGSQPETSPTFAVLFPAPLILNAQDFPACTATAVDGATSPPPECQNAVIGSGTATMWAGSPGSPQANSVREDLTVKLMNGAPAGSALLLVLNSTPTAPVQITNRVVPGAISAQPPYAFGVRFAMPQDLQNQLGLAIVLSDLDVTISGTPRPITVGATTKNMSYLQLPSCDGSLSARQITDFKSTTATPPSVTSDATVPCASGSFPDPPDLPSGPYTSPRVPTVPPPAAGGAADAISVTGGTLELGRVKAGRSGAITIPAVSETCPATATAPCAFTATAKKGRTAVASGRILVAAGAHAAPRLKLTHAGKRLVARHTSLRLTVELKLVPPGSAAIVRKLRLTLVRAGRRA